MLITIDNEIKRLGEKCGGDDRVMPFVVTIYRNKTTRTPTIVRRKTQQEARVFVEEFTGIYAHRWVTMGQKDTGIHSFTGSHAEQYADTAQYKPATLDVQQTAGGRFLSWMV